MVFGSGAKREIREITSIGFGPTKTQLKQQFKGEVPQKEKKFPTDLGEEHPYDFSITEKLYSDFGLITGVVDKYIDFIVGPGVFVKTESDRAKTLLDQFMRDTQFDSFLRLWIKQGLLNTGFAELGGKEDEPIAGLKVLKSSSMFVKRDSKGVIEGYNQFTSGFDQFTKRKSDVIHFEPFQIAQLSFNKIAGDAYGNGIIHPSMKILNKLFAAQEDLATLLRRKANSPLHAKLGDMDNVPSEAAINEFSDKMSSMTSMQEWATDAMVELKVVDFGKIGDKFDFPLNYYLDLLFFSYQVPEVLMGRGNINEGIAKVQLEAFQLRTKSIQEEVEKVIEEKIFKRVLLAQDIQENVEFEWGQPSDSAKNARISQLTELLKLNITPKMIDKIELELAALINLPDIIDIEDDQEQRKREEEEQQPKVPGENREAQQKLDSSTHIHTDSCPHVTENIDKFNETDLREWLDFDYQQYLQFIIISTKTESFQFLKANNRTDIKNGKLTGAQIDKLKASLIDGFEKNRSILEIAESIQKSVAPGDLINEKTGKLILSAINRPIEMARTQTTRLASIGADKAFLAGGITQWSWVASAGERTCPICENLHGQVFNIGEGPRPGEVHRYCRCTKMPVVKG